jgi:putative spermidine/putrescine transport system permease protein
MITLRAALSRSTLSLLLLAIAALFAIFFIWPLLDILLRSLSVSGVVNWSHPAAYFGNYTKVLGDGFLHLIELRTVELAVNSTLLTTAIGFPTAYFISRLNRRAASVVLMLILVPFWVSIVVRIFSVSSILSPNGILNQAGQAVGLPPFSLLYTAGGTLVGTTMYLLPYMILILYAGMSGVDESLLQAARTLGATPFAAFTRVYLRLVRGPVFSGVLLVFILSLSFFIVPALLGGPRDQTVAVYIQQQINIYQWGTASALGILLLVVTLACYAGVVRLSGTASPGTIGSVQAKGVTAENRFRWTPSTIVTGVVAAVAVVLLVVPVLMVFPLSIGTTQTVTFPPQGFTLQWYGQVFQGQTWLGPLGQSLAVATATGTLSAIISLVLARVVSRLRSRALRVTISGLTFAPLIAPAILLAIGLYDVELQLHITGTIVGLVAAHVIISFPLAYAVISTALAGVDVSLEQAAWTMGASTTRAFWTVTVRSIIPSILGGFGLAFVTSWDEVILALFLQTGPVKTLPVTIYQYLESGIVPAVPAVASLLVLIVPAVLAIRALVGRAARRRSSAPGLAR